MRLFWFGMFWLSGIALGRAADLPAWIWLPPLLLGMVSAALVSRRWRFWAAGWALLMAGALRFQLARPHLDSAHLIAHNDDGRMATLTGVVIDFPDVRDRYIGLRVRAESIEYPGADGSSSVEGIALARASRFGDYAYGDRVEVSGVLETPPVFEDFSYREYLARQGIYSLISNASVITVASDQASPVLGAIFRLRQRALDTVYALYPDPEASLMAGILLGVESGIDPELRQAFNDTSTTHIIAISGFNITVLAALVISLFGRWLGPRRGALAATAAIALYTVLVGADPAVIRAAIMGGLALLARLLGRQTHAMASLSAAAMVMTLADPLILWDVGFQLSFAATLGLVLYAEPITQTFVALASRWVSMERAERLAGPVGEFGLFTLAAQVTTLPLTAYYFHRLSLASLLANPVILPAQPPLMVSGGLATIAGMIWRPVGQLLAWVSWPFPAFTIRSVQAFANLPSAAISLGRIELPAIAFLYIVLFGITAWLKLPPERRPFRDLALSLPRPPVLASLVALFVLTGLTWREARDRPDGRLHVHVLDVGRGEAVLIESPTGRFVLVNGGGSPLALSSALGAQLPLFDRSLDWLVVAGTDDDQIAGLVGLVDRYRIGNALLAGSSGGSAYRRVQQELAAEGIPMVEALRAQILDLGEGAQLEVLALGRRGAALMLTHQRARILIAPGADAQLISELMQDPSINEVTAYLLADGGNPSANPPEWLERLRPMVALLSTDMGTQWNNLPPEGIPGLEGTTLLRTDRHGWIELITDGERLWAGVERNH